MKTQKCISLSTICILITLFMIIWTQVQSATIPTQTDGTIQIMEGNSTRDH